MRKIMNKKVNIFGKTVPLFVIVLLGVGLVSAALITSWGTITGLVTVDQGLKLDGQNWDYATIVAGVTMTSLEEKTVSSGEHTLANSATVDATVTLDTACTDTGSDGCSEPTLVTTTEYLLDAPGSVPDGNEDTIYIRASDVGIVDLDDLLSMSWEIYTVEGYPAHVDIILADDIDGNTVNIDSITAEMAVDQNMGILAIAADLPNAWVKTFELDSADGHDSIGDSTIFWVTRLGAGTSDAPYGTLGSLKAGTALANPGGDVVVSISGTTKVLGFEIEVDNWIAAGNSDLRNIKINNDVVEKITVKANDDLDFTIETYFPKMMLPDVYTLITTVNAV